MAMALALSTVAPRETACQGVFSWQDVVSRSARDRRSERRRELGETERREGGEGEQKREREREGERTRNRNRNYVRSTSCMIEMEMSHARVSLCSFLRPPVIRRGTRR